MKKRIPFLITLFFMIISSTTHAQKSNYCDALKEQFYQAVKKGYLSEIDYTYYKLLSICDVN